MKKKIIYLDNHASTPLDPEVLEAMMPYFQEDFGNAASQNHRYGWQASAACELAREQIAQAIGAKTQEIYFTSGATESNNWILQGYFADNRGCFLHSNIEHSSILAVAERLARQGVQTQSCFVQKNALLELNLLEEKFQEQQVNLLSVIWANNEVGTIQKMKEIAQLCENYEVVLHSDATQALGKVDLDLKMIPLHYMSFSGHKIYGPKGIGALYIREGWGKKVRPMMLGGGHERGQRAGTLNVPGIVGLGKAVQKITRHREKENLKIRNLRDKLQLEIQKRIPGVIINGALESRLDGNLHMSFPGLNAKQLLMEFKDIALSSGSACLTEKKSPSHVLKALGIKDDLAASSLRFGIGRFNTEEEIDYAIEKVHEVYKKLSAS